MERQADPELFVDRWLRLVSRKGQARRRSALAAIGLRPVRMNRGYGRVAHLRAPPTERPHEIRAAVKMFHAVAILGSVILRPFDPISKPRFQCFLTNGSE